jgi:hypothetical protein
VLAALAVLTLAPACTSKRKAEPVAGQPAAAVAVTDDFGARSVAGGRVAPGQTAMTALRTVAAVATADGGRFVSGIDGLSGNQSTRDWFFFVNGIQSDVGATDVTLHAGDRVWWDRRPYTPAHGMDVPAVVGSYPEPFVHGTGGHAPARVEVTGSAALARALAGAGAHVSVGSSPWRVLVTAGAQSPAGGLARVDGTRVLVDDGRGLVAHPGAASAVWAVRSGGGFTLVVDGVDRAAAADAANALARDPRLLARSYAAALDRQGRVVARAGHP